MEYRNLSDNGNGTWDCEVNHPIFGWIPYTISPEDTAPVNLMLLQNLENDGHIE